MTLSKEATSAIEKMKEANGLAIQQLARERDEAMLVLKEERFQSSLNRQALVDDLMTLDVLAQHALQDIHQVKNMEAAIDRSCFHATVKLLEAIDSVTKDYR